MAGRKILLVDDDDNLRNVLEQNLTLAGFEVATADDGRAAADLLAVQPFDLVLTDLIMPRMDGIELLGEMRKHYPRIPVIAMSGGGRMPPSHYLQTAGKLGAKALMEKPFTTSELVAKLNEFLEDVPSDSD